MKQSKNIVIDVEADGPCPGLYSMVCFGVAVTPAQNTSPVTETFYGQTAPLPNSNWIPNVLLVSGFSREDHEAFPDYKTTIQQFYNWLNRIKDFPDQRIIAWSDNPAFDWQFINYYFHEAMGNNILGHSMRRIGDFSAGLKRNVHATSSWKKYRKTQHDHNPVNDAKGNVEALQKILSLNNLSF